MPVTREYLKEYLQEQPHVNQVTETVHGLLAHQDPSASADTFGLIRSKGWAPDIITADRTMVHFVKLDGSVLDDARPTAEDLKGADEGDLVAELERRGYDVPAREITDDPDHATAPKDEQGDPAGITEADASAFDPDEAAERLDGGDA